MATFKPETKIDPFRLNYAKPRNYDVKIIGGKKVLIWGKEEEPKKKREVFVVGADNLKNKSHLVPTAQERKNDTKVAPEEKRPPSSESIKSSYKTLPPIGAKSPPSRDSDLDSFVSGQLSNVGQQVLENEKKNNKNN